MITRITESKIQGCFEIHFKQMADQRGWFTKAFHEDVFKQHNINMHVAEEYFSYSHKNVFRGLHFQTPPMDLDKLVFCIMGNVTDYVVDLRVGSPTYGDYVSFDLNGNEPKAVFIPTGLAHGFHVLSDNALMQYKVSAVYDAKCDAGVSYRSLPFAKDIVNPIISDRDNAFETIENYKSPFKF